MDPAQTRAAAAELAKLLSEFDPGAVDFLESNGAALQPLFAGESWAQLATLLQSYSFSDAQTLLEESLKRFPQA